MKHFTLGQLCEPISSSNHGVAVWRTSKYDFKAAKYQSDALGYIFSFESIIVLGKENEYLNVLTSLGVGWIHRDWVKDYDEI